MLRLRGWRPYQLQCVTDAFSTKFETTQTMQNILSERIVCPLSASATLKGSGALPDAGAKVLACFASFGPAQLAFQNGRWNLTARVTVTAFAENTLAELESYEKTLEMNLALDTTLPETADLYPECWLSVEDLQCTAQGGALEVTVTARVEGTILERCTTACVESIALGEPLTPADPEISLRVYYAQAGEQLFEIARRFSVSPGQMLAANDLPEGTETLAAPRRLLVPGG